MKYVLASIYLAAVMAIVMPSCKKDKDAKPHPTSNFHPDYFIFGSYQNPCVPCDLIVPVYYMENAQKLYSVQPDSLFSTTNMMADTNYQKVQLLIDQFPAYFLNNPNSTIGCTSCGSFKTIDIMAVSGADTMKWTVDTTVGTLPAEIQPYMTQFITTWKGLRI